METQAKSRPSFLKLDFNAQLAWILLAVLSTFVISLLVSFQAGVFLLIFTAIGWWVWRQPQAGFLLLIILLAILPMLKITQTIGTFTLVKDVIIGVLFLRVFLVPLWEKKLPYRPNILLAPVLALGIWTLFELLRADSLVLGVLRARDIGLYAVLYFAVLWLGHDWRQQRERVWWFLAIVLITMVLAVYQWFFAQDSAVLRFDPVREIWIPRLSSILAHPSIFGQWLIGASTLFGALVFMPALKRYRVWLAFLLATTLPLIFLTYSRAVWLGAAAAMGAMGVAFAVVRKRRRVPSLARWAGLILLSIAVIVLLLIVLRSTPALGLLRSAFDPTYASNEERLEFLVRLVAPLSNWEAIVGRGLGDVVEQNFREVDLTAAEVTAGDARAVQLTKDKTLVDNQYLKTFIEMGVVGLVIYGWLYWRFFAGAVRLIKSEDNRLYVLGLWGVGFLAAFVVQAFFIDIWDIFPTNAMFWIIAALISAFNQPGLKSRV